LIQYDKLYFRAPKRLKLTGSQLNLLHRTKKKQKKNTEENWKQTRMWANAQRDGRDEEQVLRLGRTETWLCRGEGLMFMPCHLQCFDAVGWPAGRASGL